MKRTIRPSNSRKSKGKTNWQEIDRLTEEEIGKAATSDPDSALLTDEELASMTTVSMVKAIRLRLHMTQEQFSTSYQVPLGTVRDWEQGRYEPDQSAKTLLKLIAAIPKEVLSALDSRQ